MSAAATSKQIALRPPSEVMRLDRLGSTFPTRLSFMRILLRQMAAEDWRLRRTRFDIDGNGFGRAVYTVSSLTYLHLIAFSQFLDPTERTDRVIAEAWDATFVLFDGVPTETDIDRLAKKPLYKRPDDIGQAT